MTMLDPATNHVARIGPIWLFFIHLRRCNPSAHGLNRTCDCLPMETFANREYNIFMFLGLLAMHILEVMFFVGMAGSAIVVVISFIEDAQELFGED